MERQRKIKIFGIVALVLGLIGLTIAFAAMSRVLKINGTGNVDRANWDIHFRNVTFLSKSATASISGDPEPSNTNKGVTITGLNVTLKQPGDYVKYTADIKNEGDIDAAIKLVTPPSLTERQNELFEFKAEYTDVQAKGSKEIQDGDILRAGDIKNITITFKYKDEVVASQLPSQAEGIDLTYSILYEQLFETTTSQQQGGFIPSKPVVKELDVSKGENDNVTAYFYDDDTISIEGEGEISSDLADSLKFEGDENPYNATSITLGEGITNVPSGIYSYNEDITDVNLPSTITKIENNAFEGCTGLTSIEIPSAVTEIGDEAFKNCTNLQTITVGSALVQGVALKNMANSSASNITSIGASAFYNCTSLTNVDNLISGLTTISANMLYNCTSLTRLTIPTSVVSYGASAFSGCTGLTYLSIPGTISIAEGVFANVSNLEEVAITGTGVIPIYTTSTRAYTPWYISRNNIKNIVISEGITSIRNYAFYDCVGLTSITIPSGVTSIGQYAFSGCTDLTSITIPISVRSIGQYAFSGCTGLTYLSLPGSLNISGQGIFTNVSNLEEVAITGVRMTSYTNATYKKTPWYISKNKIKKLTISEDIKNIGNYAFYDSVGLTSITIPSGVTSIGQYAFYKCTGLTSIIIPSGVTSIGAAAFYGCTGLTSIIIPSGVTSIGDSTFSNCTGLTSITIPSGVTSIGNWAFLGCTNLSGITIPSGVTSIGEGVFNNCTGLTNITIPNGVTSIGIRAFNECTGLTSLTIPNSVTSIGNYAFYNCTGLKKLDIPGTATITYTSFYGTEDNIEEVTITGIGNMVDYFSSVKPWTSAKRITISEGITSIGNYAFSYCKELTSLIIPSSVTSIGQYAFQSCSKITSITIPNSVTSVGDHAFNNWTYSQTINIDNTSDYVSSNWDSNWKSSCSATVNYLRD